MNTTPNTSAKIAYVLATPNSETSGAISGAYPDFFDECQQAIVAGQAANDRGDHSDLGCVWCGTDWMRQRKLTPDDYTDVTLVTTGNNASFTLSTLTPCVTMENIASSLHYFYSDYLQSGSGTSTTCVDNAHTVVAMSDIFESIATTFTTPRLIPSTTT